MKTLFLLTALFCGMSLANAGSLQVSVTDKDGKAVADAVVLVFPSNRTAQPKVALLREATIVQEKMQFIPAVTLLAVGAKLRFTNSDSWDHHVRSSPAGMGQFAASNAGFDIRLEGKPFLKPSKVYEVSMDKASTGATLLGCFLHGSMRGFVYVSDSPWAVKTDADGIARFDDLPDGAAQFKVWQADQLFDTPLQNVTISAVPSLVAQQLSTAQRRQRQAPVQQDSYKY